MNTFKDQSKNHALKHLHIVCRKPPYSSVKVGLLFGGVVRNEWLSSRCSSCGSEDTALHGSRGSTVRIDLRSYVCRPTLRRADKQLIVGSASLLTESSLSGPLGQVTWWAQSLRWIQRAPRGQTDNNRGEEIQLHHDRFFIWNFQGRCWKSVDTNSQNENLSYWRANNIPCEVFFKAQWTTYEANIMEVCT